MKLEELIAIARSHHYEDGQGPDIVELMGKYNRIGEKWSERTNVDPAVKTIASISTMLIEMNPHANKAAALAAGMDGEGMSSVMYTFMLSLIGMLIDENWIILGKESDDELE